MLKNRWRRLVVGWLGWAWIMGWFPAEATAEKIAGDATWQTLFHGHDLEGWDGDPRFWRVEQGVIVGETSEANPARKNTFLIYRNAQYADFELLFQCQVTGYNFGVQYRSHDSGEWSVRGYQADFEARHHPTAGGPVDRYSGMFFDERGRMFLGQRGQVVVVKANSEQPKQAAIEVIGSVGDPVELEKIIDRDGWNEMRVIAQGYTFTHLINGRVMSMARDEDVTARRPRGLLAFQLHRGPPMQVRIQGIRIRSLP